MSNHQRLKEKLSHEFVPELNRMNGKQIGQFYGFLRFLLDHYLAGYELNRDMLLVLDNSIIQDFKHIGDHQRRPLARPRAMAFVALCRFASEWTDLPVSIAVTPVGLYEFGGRKPPGSLAEVSAKLAELSTTLRKCGLPLATLGFNSVESLFGKLNDVHSDADYLEVFANQIEQADWERDLRASHGGEVLAATWAEMAIPDDMPLKYFHPFYIRQVFGSRIEERIAEQSKGVFGEQPIRTGQARATLARLNTISSKGVLKGLGDIDLLQVCDVSRQYAHPAPYLLLGQTFDRCLSDVLAFHHRFTESMSFSGGRPDSEKQAQAFVNFMFSDPFRDHKERLEKVMPRVAEFDGHFAALCREAIDGSASASS